MIAAALGIVATILWGALTDRIGRRPVYLLGTALTVAWGMPLFLVVNTGTAIAIVIAFVVSYTICQNSLAGVQGAWFSELFAAKTRTTGASLAYQLSAVVSGFTPLVATALFAGVGWIGPALLFSAYGLLGLIAALVTRETWGRAERDEVAALEPTLALPVRPQLGSEQGKRMSTRIDRRSRRPPTASGSTRWTWARCRARATSARRSASPTCSPWSTPTSSATGPRTRTGPTATGSCSPSATTPSRSTPRWPRPGSSRSRSWQTYGSDGSRLPMSGMASYTPGMEISGGSLGPRPGRRHRDGARAAPPGQPGPRLQPALRRRARRGLDLGGRAAGRPPRPGQPHRDRRRQRAAGRRPDRGRAAHRAGHRQVARVRLARPARRRQRHPRARRRVRRARAPTAARPGC